MTFTGGSTKMTQDELNELIEKQKQAYQGMVIQAQGYNSIANPYQNTGSLYASSTGYNQMPQYYLEEKERQEIREHEREACVRIVMDMAEELNCPNLLHGVALAIKARSDLKVTKY